MNLMAILSFVWLIGTCLYMLAPECTKEEQSNNNTEPLIQGENSKEKGQQEVEEMEDHNVEEADEMQEGV